MSELMETDAEYVSSLNIKKHMIPYAKFA